MTEVNNNYNHNNNNNKTKTATTTSTVIAIFGFRADPGGTMGHGHETHSAVV